MVGLFLLMVWITRAAIRLAWVCVWCYLARFAGANLAEAAFARN